MFVSGMFWKMYISITLYQEICKHAIACHMHEWIPCDPRFLWKNDPVRSNLWPPRPWFSPNSPGILRSWAHFASHRWSHETSITMWTSVHAQMCQVLEHNLTSKSNNSWLPCNHPVRWVRYLWRRELVESSSKAHPFKSFNKKCNKQQALDLTSFHTDSWGLDWCFSFEKTRRLKSAKKWHFEQNMFREYMWIWWFWICCVILIPKSHSFHDAAAAHRRMMMGMNENL